MNKTSKEEMIREIGDFLHIYMKSGKLNKKPFFEHIHSNVKDMEKLLQIHFLLKKEVLTYVKKLPDLFKQFKTTTKSTNKITEDNIRGKIDWQGTIQTRLKRNYKERTFYSVVERNRMYESDENLVLKQSLSILYHLVVEQKLLDNHYEWSNSWDDTLHSSLNDIYSHNIYLKRINLPKKNLDDRVIDKIAKHRNPLYAEAASLLLLYNRIMKHDLSNEEVASLLHNSFIEPASTETLFELYWIMKLIQENDVETLLHIYDTGNKNLIASWVKNGIEYRIYHDSTGSGLVKFSVSFDDIQGSNHPYLIQKEKSIIKQRLCLMKLLFFDQNICTCYN